MRDQIFHFLKRELIGPDPIPPYVQDNGEEILINEPPRLRYGAGILFPQAASVQETDSTHGSENAILNELAEVANEAPLATIEGEDTSSGKADDILDANDDTVNLANAFLPSVMGFSCFLAVPENGLSITMHAGRYRGEDITVERKGKPVKKQAYSRESLDTVINVLSEDLPTIRSRSRDFHIKKDGQNTGLVLNIRNRTLQKQSQTELQLLTFSLINDLKSSTGHIDNENCFFQVEFSVKAKDVIPCFVPYPEEKYSPDVEDERSTQLLYRNYHTFAVGHGCAPCWVESGKGRASEIRAEVIPSFEIKSIVPRRFPDLQLRMYDLSDAGDKSRITSNLTLLCQKYEDWILKLETIANSELTEELSKVANRHIQNCRKCLTRIREGISLIESDSLVRRAFSLMNRAILIQQLRFRMKLREWKTGRDGKPVVETVQEPDIHDPKTWPDWSPERGTDLGMWYPFQIAFILMNLKSMARPEGNDRNIVDLIWFPTGGGKTEAYLGLSAFTIFLKRLRNKNDSGTTVLMRYTLRLLTAQQYQRAASLICACELIRRENEAELGKERITIGLWVGEALTPNKRTDAVKAFNKMNTGESDENPFIILKCPWCGVQTGPVGKPVRIMGYRKTRQPSSVIFQCHNQPECIFSVDDYCLPLLVVDEDIYESPPSIIIGTVDKFAMLPWKPEARTLFGFREQERVSPPELIIQDELHLIAGPLGSMVGHYETLIYELCTNHKGQIVTGPKIVASTATITRAAQQIHALYGCGQDKVFLFPPQCLDAGESFFAYVDSKAPGRMYAGVHASGLPSHTTAQVRVISSLLQSTKSAPVDDEKKRDPYWTVVSYFNSLRELGHAETLIQADIREYLNAMWIRKGIRKEGHVDHRRFVNRVIELTSRVSSTKIPEALQALETSYSPTGDNHPVDICLATNMISVGVDVQRLGLMAVIGQPKTTSEYIQATSRVGRSERGPGLVVIIFNTAKPRDRSHYENFYSYHSAIYSHVEPTSVTPFSAPVRERALHAILVGLVRYLGKQNTVSPQPFPSKTLLDSVRNIIQRRVSSIDPQETDLTVRLLAERIDEWARRLPPKYGDFYPEHAELPLMYPAGISPPEEWDLKSWPTPTSMRTVDVSCDAGVIERYPSEEGTE